MSDKTATANADLTWLVDDLVHRVVEARYAVILSTDGLLVAASRGLVRGDAEHLAAAASGLSSLARGAGRHFGDSVVRRTMIEFGTGYLFVTAAGNGACLAVVTGTGIDVGVAAYEMEMLVVRVGQYITTPLRAPAVPAH
ncbi:roadblock/LC7 domain-containing protein [Catellatospora tritici]|uniref:roadblock/LC7 domain-containing protein n=1 Tax=Catellatospora tritici TaxID=2851566 RepID=UPI001C2DD842|nr:roadblock/LC7 domain-containing protein [Catellatospora tritici]MBV1850788.1 roadblock/LC7 domain-containing protein [Catellatospora tritici]MBV1851041.1 roadblock/LC7 domain-containing protein [Catellatospora tritici]